MEKETIESRHKKAKETMFIIIKTLSYEDKISATTMGNLLDLLSKIEDNPYSLLGDFENKEITFEKIEGKTRKRYLLKTQITEIPIEK